MIYMNPIKIEPKHFYCLPMEGCNSTLEILGRVLFLFTSLLSPLFPFAIYHLIQKKGLMRFKCPDLIEHVCNQMSYTF